MARQAVPLPHLTHNRPPPLRCSITLLTYAMSIAWRSRRLKQTLRSFLGSPFSGSSAFSRFAQYRVGHERVSRWILLREREHWPCHAHCFICSRKTFAPGRRSSPKAVTVIFRTNYCLSGGYPRIARRVRKVINPACRFSRNVAGFTVCFVISRRCL
jgi:hypothetical protein